MEEQIAKALEILNPADAPQRGIPLFNGCAQGHAAIIFPGTADECPICLERIRGCDMGHTPGPRPDWWFRSVAESPENEPQNIEYLKGVTGETFIHIHGTAYWDYTANRLDRVELSRAGITHWRIVTPERAQALGIRNK